MYRIPTIVKLLVLPGDGIGPEITEATLAVLGAADRRFKLGLSYERKDMGLASLKSQGTTLPEGIVARAREVDGVILGPISHLDYPRDGSRDHARVHRRLLSGPQHVPG